MSDQIKPFIITIIGCLLLGFGVGAYVVWNKWQQAKLEYKQKLEQSVDMYEQQIKNLQSYINTIENDITDIEQVVDSLNNTIASRNEALDNLKKEHDQTLKDIDNMSHNELIKFFSDRY